MKSLAQVRAYFQKRFGGGAAIPASPVTLRLEELQQKLATLTIPQRLQFALDCADAVLPYYEKWSVQAGLGNPATMRAALEYLRTESLPAESRLQAYVATIEAMIPYTEDNATVSSSGALDAGLCVLGTLKCALSGEAKAAYQAGLAAITVYDITEPEGATRLPMGGPITRRDVIAQDLARRAIEEWQRQLALITHLSQSKAD